MTNYYSWLLLTIEEFIMAQINNPIVVIILVLWLILLNYLYFKLKRTLFIQNAKLVNTHLSRKLMQKLLLILTGEQYNKKLQTISDLILDYYDLDLIAVKTLHNAEVLKFQNHSRSTSKSNYFFNKEFDNLLTENSIEKYVGHKDIQNNLNKQITLFKNMEVTMLAISKKHHEINMHDINSIENEIMLLYQLALKESALQGLEVININSSMHN